MKISKEKFEELVSAYLDNEATPEEKIELSKCIRQDREMARIFYRECKIYAATCKIYGREPTLQELDGVPNPLNPAKKKIAWNARAEWAAATALASAAGARVALTHTTWKFRQRKSFYRPICRAQIELFYGQNGHRRCARLLRNRRFGI